MFAHDDESQGKPLIAWDDPVAKGPSSTKNEAMVLLAALEATSALGLLALVAGQDIEQADDGTWRITRNVALTGSSPSSTPKTATCTSSDSEYRDGLEPYVAIEPETGLVTAGCLSPANAPHGHRGDLLDGEDRGLHPLGKDLWGTSRLA